MRKGNRAARLTDGYHLNNSVETTFSSGIQERRRIEVSKRIAAPPDWSCARYPRLEWLLSDVTGVEIVLEAEDVSIAASNHGLVRHWPAA